MKLKKIIALALISSTVLCAAACGKKAETTDTPATESGTADTTLPEDVYGEPTDSFVLPDEAAGIVGTWKLAGEDAAAIKGMELWDFKADGTYEMLNIDESGKVTGNTIPGQYRINGNELTVIMMIYHIKYTFKLEEGKLLLNDHGSDSVLEKYTGSITR